MLHDERNDENLDELLFELFNDEFDNITLNLFDKNRSAANDIRNGCLSKTVRDVQGKTPEGLGEVFYPWGRVGYN